VANEMSIQTVARNCIQEAQRQRKSHQILTEQFKNIWNPFGYPVETRYNFGDTDQQHWLENIGILRNFNNQNAYLAYWPHKQNRLFAMIDLERQQLSAIV
jgi:hypothetical protein